MRNKPEVLHIVSDYPDQSGLVSTQAVKNLISSTQGDIESIIISFRRTKRLKLSFEKNGNIYIFRAFYPPFGLLLIPLSYIYSYILCNKLESYGVTFDIVHGHKLTTDGSLTYFLSGRKKCKFMISIRGDTDKRFITYKPLSRWFFKKIYKNASVIFWVSKWYKSQIESTLKSTPCSEVLLPNITCAAQRVRPENKLCNSNRLLFVGRLNMAGPKGLYDTILALKKNNDVELDIVGNGSIKQIEKITSFVNKNNLSDRVNLLGRISSEKLFESFDNYFCLVMPSKSETFGMVYVEALKRGLPVIGCKDSGIYGYFEDKHEFAVFVDYGDIDSLRKSIAKMHIEQYQIISDLRKESSQNIISIFSEESVSNNYLQGIETALGLK